MKRAPRCVHNHPANCECCLPLPMRGIPSAPREIEPSVAATIPPGVCLYWKSCEPWWKLSHLPPCISCSALRGSVGIAKAQNFCFACWQVSSYFYDANWGFGVKVCRVRWQHEWGANWKTRESLPAVSHGSSCTWNQNPFIHWITRPEIISADYFGFDTHRRNSRDTTEGCKLFCNSCFNKQSVTVTMTVCDLSSVVTSNLMRWFADTHVDKQSHALVCWHARGQALSRVGLLACTWTSTLVRWFADTHVDKHSRACSLGTMPYLFNLKFQISVSDG